MKKLFMTLCLILTLTFVMPLSACGSSKDTLYILSFKPEYNEFFEYVNELYLSENPEIKRIDYDAVDLNDFESVFDSRIQSNYLDVFTSEVSYMMQGISSYMRDLGEKEYFNNIEQKYLDLGKFYDPSVGGEPQQLTMVYEVVGSVVFYNKDIFNKYGLTEPQTWSEFISICDTLKNKPDVANPFMFGGLSSWPANSIMNSVIADTVELNQPDFFGSLKNYDTDSSIRFNNKNWISAFEKIQQIGSYMSTELFGTSYDYAASYFSTGMKGKGMYPMMIDGTWAYTQIDAEFDLGYFILPAEENSLNSDGKKNFATKPGMSFSVYKDSNKSEAAEKYLELLYRADVYEKFLEISKMPSIMPSVQQKDSFISGIFSNDNLTSVEMYDSRMPRYMPIPSSSSLISLMKGDRTPKEVADNLQELVEVKKEDWQKYVNLSHTKPQ